MTIELYGTTPSRAFRCVWMLHELGIPFKHEPLGARATRSAEFMQINPNGRIPALKDGTCTLFESTAINLYLAMKYGDGRFWPDDVTTQAKAMQWSVWVMTELDPLMVQLLLNRALLPEDQRDEARAVKAEESMTRPLKVLDAALADSSYLLGNDFATGFSVADVNVCGVFSWSRPGGLDLAPYPHLMRWFKACWARPARKQTL